MLDKMIKILVDEYGILAVSKAFIRALVAEHPSSVLDVDRLALSMSGSLFLNRIKVYRQISGAGLRQSKEWVESHYADRGSGPPLDNDSCL